MSGNVIGESVIRLVLEKDKYEREMDSVEKDAEKRSSGLAGRIGKSAGLAVAGFAGIAAGGLGAAIKVAADFEKQIDQVGAVAGATEEQIGGLSDTAKRIGKETAFSASEAAQAMELLASNGISVADMMNGATDATVALAAAGGTSLVVAADTASTAMAVWGLKTAEMSDVVNRLAGAANVSRFGVEDMSLAIASGGGAAATAGVEFQDFSTSIAAMAPYFSSGSDAGTSFKTMLQRLTPQTDKAAGVMKDLGIIAADGSNRFYDAQGNLKGMSEITQVLHDATKDLSEEQKTQALATIFGSDALRAAAALSTLTGEEFAKMSETMRTTDAQAVAAQRMENLSGSMDALMGSVETIGIEIGSRFLPHLARMANFLADKLPAAFELADKHITPFIKNIGDRIGNAVTYVIDVFNILRGIITGDYTAKLNNDWNTAYTIIAKVGGFINDTLIPTIKNIVTQGINFVVNTGLPMLQRFSSWFLTEALPVVLDFGTKAVDVFVNKIIPAIASFADTVRPIAEQVFGFIGANIDKVIVVVGTFVGIIATVGPIVSTLVPIIASVAGAFTGVTTAVAGGSTVLTAIVAVLGGPVTVAVVAVAAIVAGLALAWKTNFLDIQGFTHGLWEFIKPILSAVEKRFDEFVTKILPELEGAWENISAAIQATVKFLGSVIEAVFTTVGNFIDRHGDEISSIIDTVWSYISRTIDNTLSIISNTIQLVLNIIQGDWSGAWENIRNIGSAIWDQIKNTISTAVNLLRDLLAIAWGEISRAAEGAWEGIKSYLSDRANDIKTNVTGSIDSAKTSLEQLWKDIAGTANSKWDEIKTHIDNTKSAMADAIRWPFEQARDTIGSIAGAIKSNIAYPFNLAARGITAWARGVRDAVNWISGKLGLGAIIPGDLGGIPEFASGVRNFEGGYALVGERGPELVKLPKGSDVFSSRETERMTRGIDAPGFVGGITDVVKGAVNKVGDLAGDALSTLKDWVGKGAEWVVNAAFKAIGVSLNLSDPFSGLGSTLFSKVKGYVVDFVGELLDSLKSKIPPEVTAPSSPGAGGWTRPTYGTTTQEFGRNEFAANAYTSGSHSGIDIANVTGTPIYAANAGTVTSSGWNGGYGNAITVQHSQMLQTLYGHISSLIAMAGKVVQAGEQIGLMGSTGYSTGPHLHFEVRENGVPVNPRNYVAFADGGITTRPTLGMLSEYGQREAVIPLDQSNILTDPVRAIADYFCNNIDNVIDRVNGFGGGNLEVNLNGPMTFLDELHARAKAKGIGFAIENELRRRGLA